MTDLLYWLGEFAALNPRHSERHISQHVPETHSMVQTFFEKQRISLVVKKFPAFLKPCLKIRPVDPILNQVGLAHTCK
jgi:hypothetical protein